MIVSDKTIQAKSRGDYSKNLSKKGPNISKKMAKNVLKNPRRARNRSKRGYRICILEALKELNPAD